MKTTSERGSFNLVGFVYTHKMYGVIVCLLLLINKRFSHTLQWAILQSTIKNQINSKQTPIVAEYHYQVFPTPRFGSSLKYNTELILLLISVGLHTMNLKKIGKYCIYQLCVTSTCSLGNNKHILHVVHATHAVHCTCGPQLHTCTHTANQPLVCCCPSLHFAHE